jgi:DNA recombination protein RmuC
MQMTEITGLLLGALIVVLAAVAWTLLSTRRELGELRARAGAPDATAALLQQQIESVRVEGRSGQDVLRQDLASVSSHVKDELTTLQRGVTLELRGVTQEVTRQLQDGMQLIQSAQTTMGERLDRAAKVVGEVQGSLGSLREATQRVLDVGREIQGLEQVLKSPKVRGGLGETMLERLLDEMLPREHWVAQHGFRSGEKVDAAIRIGDRIVPVDAKFPLENFRRMLGETDDAQRRQYRKAFARDVKLRVDEIAKKYILPDESTYDFALMYVPAENVYYEIAIRPEDADEEPIGGYALSRRVVPVSPNSIFAYLQVIVLGLRGLRIEANARQIEEDLARLGGDLGKLRTPLATLGRHLGNAQKQFDDAQRELDRFETKLDEIGRKRVGGELPAGDDAPRLPGMDA